MKITDLSALVASRLCHDLVSPVGAISNGLEIIAEEDDPEIMRQAVELLNMSVRQAEYKLTFYRMAFGASASAGGEIASGDVVKAASNYLGEEKVAFEWASDAVPLNRLQTRLLSNLILLGRDCLPRGGTLKAVIDNGRIEVVASGPNCRLREEMRQVLAEELVDPMPHMAPAVLLMALKADTGADISVSPHGEDMRLSATLAGR